eukprot:c16969_g1_i2.p1 GENE.c16969_g1_i2~~c16969_g1_i2.p1  ORF type:complete len:306 (+),score=21.06 c16969_g1_i2:66-983(+)
MIHLRPFATTILVLFGTILVHFSRVWHFPISPTSPGPGTISVESPPPWLNTSNRSQNQLQFLIFATTDPLITISTSPNCTGNPPSSLPFQSPLPLSQSPSSPPSHSPNSQNNPGLVISLLFNESPEWLHYWLKQAAQAIDIPFCVIVATPLAGDLKGLADIARRYNDLEGGCVVLSPPSERESFGYDLLRGHIINLRVAFNEPLPAFTHSTFTHMVLLASNVGFIRKVTSQRISDLMKTAPRFPNDGTRCQTPQRFGQVFSKWYHARNVVRDQVFWKRIATQATHQYPYRNGKVFLVNETGLRPC